MASAMANIYLKLIKEKQKTLEEVPDKVRGEVAELLEAEKKAAEEAANKQQ